MNSQRKSKDLVNDESRSGTNTTLDLTLDLQYRGNHPQSAILSASNMQASALASCPQLRLQQQHAARLGYLPLTTQLNSPLFAVLRSYSRSSSSDAAKGRQENLGPLS
jgi:hypothetical protein